MKNLDTMNRLYWLINESQNKDPLAIEKVIAQASEHLADADFFIAEVFGILSALVELKEVCQRGAGPSENRRAAGGK